jgi:hypothetical protein
MIQASHPDIDFDWPVILKGRPESASERPRTEPLARPERTASRPADRADRRGRPEGTRRPDRRSGSADAADPKPAMPPAPPRLPEVEPSAVETGPAAARLGATGLGRLRARYAEIVGRIHARVEDDSRRAELNALAARLNPDEWGSDEAVVAGLEGYEATYEQLKHAIGGRRPPTAPAQTPVDEVPESGAPERPDEPE